MSLGAAFSLFVVGAWLGAVVGFAAGVVICAPHKREEEETHV